MNKSKTIPVALLLTSVVSCPISASATTSNVAAVNQMEQQQSGQRKSTGGVFYFIVFCIFAL